MDRVERAQSVTLRHISGSPQDRLGHGNSQRARPITLKVRQSRFVIDSRRCERSGPFGQARHASQRIIATRKRLRLPKPLAPGHLRSPLHRHTASRSCWCRNRQSIAELNDDFSSRRSLATKLDRLVHPPWLSSRPLDNPLRDQPPQPRRNAVLPRLHRCNHRHRLPPPRHRNRLAILQPPQVLAQPVLQLPNANRRHSSHIVAPCSHLVNTRHRPA